VWMRGGGRGEEKNAFPQKRTLLSSPSSHGRWVRRGFCVRHLGTAKAYSRKRSPRKMWYNKWSMRVTLLSKTRVNLSNHSVFETRHPVRNERFRLPWFALMASRYWRCIQYFRPRSSWNAAINSVQVLKIPQNCKNSGNFRLSPRLLLPSHSLSQVFWMWGGCPLHFAKPDIKHW